MSNEKVLLRLKTARGQIDAVIKMIEDGRYCIDISNQLLAIQSLIKNANNDMIQFKTLINYWYSKDISRKIKSSVWARKEKGMFLGAIAPYGYEKSKEDKHKLIINESQAKVVKRIFEEYSSGKTPAEIVKGLNEDNIPSPNNNANNGEIRYLYLIHI